MRLWNPPPGLQPVRAWIPTRAADPLEWLAGQMGVVGNVVGGVVGQAQLVRSLQEHLQSPGPIGLTARVISSSP